ncbi:MAG: hypothetical protein H0V49_05180 [Nocardioidaceae bacterium]|nr:hypothetical protein [Nocardioidaceae bacterium]
MRKKWMAAAVVAGLGVMPAVQAANMAVDWGLQHENATKANSAELFGVAGTLPASAEGDIDANNTPPAQQVLLAEGLKARGIAKPAELADMMAFWPDDSRPEYAFACIEQGRADDGMNPGVQRTDLETGEVITVVYGTDRCDGIRRTPWDTIVFTEETDDGRAYELLRPDDIDPQYILDRETGAVRGDNVVQRRAMGTFAWEGLHIFPNGTTIAGDELRPEEGMPGGSMFRFQSRGTDSSGSPLARGRLQALRVAGGDGETDYGQGAEVGLGEWVTVDADTARESAHAVNATGYYRPEDLHKDPLADDRRVCWANTGNAELKNYGEVLCLSLGNRPEVQRFVLGNPELNQPDNLAFQPGTGNLYVIEDNPHGDIWACLRDGADTDLLTDGCVRILSVRDEDAEPTGFTFAAGGRTAYLHIQHNDDPEGDPLLRIRGWTKP